MQFIKSVPYIILIWLRMPAGFFLSPQKKTEQSLIRYGASFCSRKKKKDWGDDSSALGSARALPAGTLECDEEEEENDEDEGEAGLTSLSGSVTSFLQDCSSSNTDVSNDNKR